MPAVQPPAKVLVTGANGFVAVSVVNALLEKGYSVRGTVRSASRGEYLKKFFAKYGEKFELVVVEDITVDGAFDEAVKDVDAIEHTASPFHFNVDDPDEIIRPAVHGTLGVLQSALKNGTKVQRIVITSSTASVIRIEEHPLVLSEKDWGDQSVEKVERLGKEADNGSKYRASKTLAEKAAWAFVKEHKPKWDLVALNPPYVFGPPSHEVSSPEALNTSLLDWYTTVVSKTRTAAKAGSEFVDVRDLGEAHALALSTPEAGGERFIISSGRFEWQQFFDAKEGRPLTKEIFQPVNSYDNSKGKKVFGIKYKTIEESTLDTIEEFKRRGWQT